MLARLCFGLAILWLTGAVSATPAEFRPISDFHHTAWTADQGSPGDTWAIAQTPDGWLWFGGPRGLFRFDGVSFEPVAIQGRDPAQSSAVYSLLAEASGDLWIGYVHGGVTRITNGSMHHYGEADGLPIASVFTMGRDANDVLWAATIRGLMRLEGGRWHKAGPEIGFTDENATSVHLDGNGTFWIATMQNLFRLKRGEQRIEHAGAHPKDGADFTLSPDGRLWYIDDAGVHLLPDQPAPALQPTRTKASRSLHALFDRDGQLWTTPVGGLLRHPVPQGAQEILFANSPASRFGEKDGLSGESVHTVMEDREGNIWVASRGGIDRFRPTNVRKLLLSGERSPTSALAAGDDGSVWIGVHYGGFTRGPLDGLWKAEQFSATRVLPDVIKPITAAHRDASGALWIGGWEGIWRRDARGKFIKLPDLPETARGHLIHAIAVDQAGRPWVSDVQSALFRLQDGQWQQNGGLAALPSVRPTVHARDEAGRLWFGYRDGGVAFVDGENVKLFGSQLGIISAIHVGRFITVAGQRAVTVFKDGRFHPLTADDPAALEGVTGIVESEDGDLWLNSFRGAVRIAARDLEQAVRTGTYNVSVEAFDAQDGYPGQAQNVRGLPTLIRGTDNRLWFAGSKGLGSIDPRRVRRNRIPPAIQIRSVVADDKSYPLSEIVSLPKGSQDLQVSYTALSYSRPEKLRFRYRLVGYDQTWTDAGPRRQAFYTSLPPGEYRFQVIAANESGVWNEVGAAQNIVIPPLFVQTRTFVALCVLMALAVMYAAYLLRIRQVTARERGRLEARLAERERIARELHDTLLQGIQGLILRLQLTADRDGVPDEARKDINDQLDRAQALLIDGRDRVHDLRKTSTAPLSLKQQLAAAAQLHSATQIRILESGTPRELHPLVREEVGRIAIEAMLNAAQHADAKTIEVELCYERRQFRLEVRDDGRGMDEEFLRSGREKHFGIVGMHERARKIRARLDLTSSPGAGTRVSLAVPASIAHASRH